MIIQFKNRYIFFSTESCWHELPISFKYLLHQLVTTNSDEEYVQTLDVPEDVLLKIYRAVSAQPEGVATMNNEVMEADLMPQILAAHNLQYNAGGGYFEPGEESPNEAGRIMLAIQQFKASNRAIREAKILNGKTQILQ